MTPRGGLTPYGFAEDRKSFPGNRKAFFYSTFSMR